MVSMSVPPALGTLRKALRTEVASTSLRSVSRQAGMSAAGLQRFLAGGQPYTATRRALERWYVLHGPGKGQGAMTADAALSVLRVLVQDLAPSRQRPASRAVVATMESAYRAAGFPRPAWLAEAGRAVEDEAG